MPLEMFFLSFEGHIVFAPSKPLSNRKETYRFLISIHAYM